jgi:hypothetical protein
LVYHPEIEPFQILNFSSRDKHSTGRIGWIRLAWTGLSKKLTGPSNQRYSAGIVRRGDTVAGVGNRSPAKKPGVKPKVILRRALEYDPDAISRIIREGIEAFGLADRIKDKITVKPNVVFAHHKIAPAAFTRPEFVDGLVTALKAEA